MEESNKLLSDGTIGHSVPLKRFETERNANDPKLKSDEIEQQGDGSCNNEERSQETIIRPGKEAMDRLGMWLYPAFSCSLLYMQRVPRKPKTIEITYCWNLNASAV
jgi:hypothetical protein